MAQLKIWTIMTVLCTIAHAMPGAILIPDTSPVHQKQERMSVEINANISSDEGLESLVKEAVMLATQSEASRQETASKSYNENLPYNRTSPRGLAPSMEMLDSKRRPKPKKPMGNDIGVARGLEPRVEDVPSGSYSTGKLETTMSTGFSIPQDLKKTTKKPTQDEEAEAAEVSREMHEIVDSIPKMPPHFFPHLQIQKDPEEEAINQRITEVARQLAESAMRKEYEEGKIGHILPIPTPSPYKTGYNSDGDRYRKIQAIRNQERQKFGKSFGESLPLVSHLPQETAPLQLISDVQQIQQSLIREGFYPATPPPELIGPLFGQPLLPEESPDTRGRRALSKNFPVVDKMSVMLGFMLPEYMVVDIPRTRNGYYQVGPPRGGSWTNSFNDVDDSKSH